MPNRMRSVRTGRKGLQEGLSNWVDNASDYASQAAQLATEGISGMVNNITEMLNGNKVEWRNWASSVLQEISKVLMNAAIVNGIKTAANGMSGAGGFIGSIGDWLGGAVANAKGGALLARICLHGDLQRFGRRLSLYVNTAAEAIRALSLQVPGFPPSDERRLVPDTYCRL